MVVLMIDVSNACTDSCLIYNVIDCIITDLRSRLKLHMNLVVVSSSNISVDIVKNYCINNCISYNIINMSDESYILATSEIDVAESILLAIPKEAAIDVDDTMTRVGSFLRNKVRVIMLYDYNNVTMDTMSENIMYYNF